MVRRLGLVALFSLTVAIAVTTPAIAVSADSKVTVGSPATPYLPNGSNEPALAMDANHPAVLAAGANDLVDNSPCKGSLGDRVSGCAHRGIDLRWMRTCIGANHRARPNRAAGHKIRLRSARPLPRRTSSWHVHAADGQPACAATQTATGHSPSRPIHRAPPAT
jgi:hypothetical protein